MRYPGPAALALASAIIVLIVLVGFEMFGPAMWPAVFGPSVLIARVCNPPGDRRGFMAVALIVFQAVGLATLGTWLMSG